MNRQKTTSQLYEEVIKTKEFVNKALEQARRKKLIGSSLDAKITFFIYNLTPDTINFIEDADWSQLCIVSNHEVAWAKYPPDNAYRAADYNGLAVLVEKASGEKCPRCRQIGKEGMGTCKKRPELCGRCAEAVNYYDNNPTGF